MTQPNTLRVSVLGYGAIGSRVVTALAAGEVPGATLAGVVTRTVQKPEMDGHRAIDLAEALLESDLIVEAAGGGAVREHGPTIISSGLDLLLSSVGVLADAELRTALLHVGPGDCMLTSGAIGGLDILAAAARDGGLDTATITSTKRAATLVQPWMSRSEAESLRTATTAYALFEGSVAEAIELYPNSLNVAVAVAHGTGLWAETRVRLVADPSATLTTHEIHASGASGRYDVKVTNNPLPSNPTSSAVVSAALLSGIAKIANANGRFV